MGKRFWPVTATERKEVQRIFKLPEVRDVATSLKNRKKDDEVKVVGAAYWMKGCSSLGRLRFCRSYWAFLASTIWELLEDAHERVASPENLADK
jgi:hypothetical protein